MDYKEKYDELVDAIKVLQETNPSDEGIQNWVNDNVPELAESKDERIRKCLITVIKIQKEGSFGLECNHGASWNEMLSWLEKQGEQKSIDKVEQFGIYEGLTDFERTLANICIGWIRQELGWKQYIRDNADVLLKIAIKKFNSIQDAPFKQKSAWSEEDEEMYQNIHECLKNGWKKLPTDLLKCESWFKSLKQRIREEF